MKTATPLHKIHILMYFTMNHEKSQGKDNKNNGNQEENSTGT